MLKIFTVILLLIAIGEGWVIYYLQDIGQRVYLPNYYFSEHDPKYTDDYFTAKGSWISDTKLADAAQTTEIHCYKEFGYCFDTTARIFDNKLLTASSELYEIVAWSKDEIVTKSPQSAFGCVAYMMKIDRRNKRVTSVRTTIDNQSGACQGVQDTPIASYLGDGIERQNKMKAQ
jgi:hypothetical protein